MQHKELNGLHDYSHCWCNPRSEYLIAREDFLALEDEWYEYICHCGESIYTDPSGFTRNLCEECSRVRCDVDQGACRK